MSRLNLKRCLHLTTLALSLSTLASCASHLNQQQCASINWYQVGFADGSGGNFARDLAPAMQDCAKFGITVNANQYQKGWQAGVRQFCQPAEAEQMGIRGQPYNAICPKELSAVFDQAWRRGLRRYCIPSTGYNLGRQGANFPDFCAPDQAVKFRNAYDDGYRIYQAVQGLNNDINELDAKIIRVQQRIRENKKQIDQLNQQLNNGQVPPMQRGAVMLQAQNLNTTNLQLREEIGRLENQRTRLKQQQRDYETR